KQKLRAGLHVEQLGDLEKEREQACHGNGFGRLAVDRLADGPQRLREGGDVVVRGHITRLEMHLRHTTKIASDETVEDFGEEAPFLLGKAAHYAEIDGYNGAVRLHEQIAGMHVGMKEAVAQRLAPECLDQR